MAASVALAAVGAALTRAGGEAGDPAPRPATSATSAPDQSSTEAAGPLDGRWHTRRLSRADVVETLRAAGVAATVADAFAQGLPPGEFRIHLLVSRSLLSARIGPDTTFHIGTVVEGDTLTLRPLSGPPSTWTLGWRRTGDRLRFEVRRTDVIAYDGFPARVHTLATFAVAPFRNDP